MNGTWNYKHHPHLIHWHGHVESRMRGNAHVRFGGAGRGNGPTERWTPRPGPTPAGATQPGHPPAHHPQAPTTLDWDSDQPVQDACRATLGGARGQETGHERRPAMPAATANARTSHPARAS